MEVLDSQIDLQPQSDDELLEWALGEANIPTLLLLLVQLTGDTKWLEAPYLPTPIIGFGDHDTGGLPDDVQDDVRKASFAAIRKWQEGAPPAIPHPSRELLGRMLSVSVGESVPQGYVDMVATTMERAEDLKNATHVPSPRPDGFRAIIVGAGVSGLCMAVKLQSIGVPYTIIEKNDVVGGTWHDNRYPGCGVDTPNHYYSFSFAPSGEWTEYFCRAPELKAYLVSVAEKFNLRSQIVFNTEVQSAEYDADAKEWVVSLVGPDGIKSQQRANILISASGLFNPPAIPDVKGLSSFKGTVAHTAAWPDDFDWRGKRVAVIGTGASAMQLVPAMAPHVEKLTVFQRTPQWSFPLDEKWRRPITPALRWLMKEVPLYTALYRERLGWVINDRSYPALIKDPQWPHLDRSLNQVSEDIRNNLTDYISTQLASRPELIERSIPRYPPFGKRPLIDHGWYETLLRDNVELVPERALEVTEDAVVDESGNRHPVDIIALATGYNVLRLLSTFELRGRNGKTIRELWGDEDGSAYLGAAIPGFPNFFCLYGPSSQPAHGGSYISVAEHQTDFVCHVIEQMVDQHVDEIEVRQDVFEAYVDRVDATHKNMVWSHDGVRSYYRNSKGRVVINHPFLNYEFWKATTQADLDDFRQDSQG